MAIKHARSLRLALAVVLVLAGLAGARLQGMMAGGQPLGAALASLCSGERAPVDGETPPRHSHCVLCSLPSVDAPTPVILAARVANPALLAVPPRVPVTRQGLACPYQSQGPPADQA